MHMTEENIPAQLVPHNDLQTLSFAADDEEQPLLPKAAAAASTTIASFIAPPPDGGLTAWTQVLTSHLINFNCFGYMLSYGVWQDYYTTHLGRPAADISLIGTVELFLVYFVGALSGRALDAGHYRRILTLGLFLQLVGLVGTSFATRYWHLFLAQGICQGLGNGLLFCPALALVATYFPPSRRAIPISCVACGGATGGLVFPAMARALLARVGFAWTIRAMGAVVLFNAIVILTFSRARLPPRSATELVDWRALREPTFLLFTSGTFLTFWGLYFAYYYAETFARTVLHVSPQTSFNLLIVLNAAGLPGRLVPALISDRLLGPLNTLIPVAMTAGALLFAWTAVGSLPALYVWVVAYGFFAGGVQSLFQAASAALTADVEKVGVRIGMTFTLVSFACLTGPLIAGRLVELRGGDYLYAQVFGGSVMVGGSVLLGSARAAQDRARRVARAAG